MLTSPLFAYASYACFPPLDVRTCVRMRQENAESAIACALIPRFTLLAVVEGRRELLLRPMALAPEPGGPQVVGEASGPAEAFGVHAGMRLGEALARCPELALVPPDPERAEAAWEDALRRLEGIGAAVEPGRPRRAPVVVPAAMTRSFLAPLPVSLLRERLDDEWGRVDLPDKLERLGVESLGQLAALPDAAIADRFGRPGLVALRMARGSEEPLRPRRAPEGLVERIELGAAISGPRLV